MRARLLLATTLLIMLLMPAANAAVLGPAHGQIETSATIHGRGDGQLRHTGGSIDWRPARLEEAEPRPLATGARLVVSMREETTVQALGYRHTEAQTRLVGEFVDAQLLLSELNNQSRVGIALGHDARGTIEGRTGFELELPPVLSNQRLDVGPGSDPRARFEHWGSDSIQLRQLDAVLVGRGDVGLMFQNASFTVEAGGARQVFTAAREAGPSAGTAAKVVTLRVYFVDLVDGRYDTSVAHGTATVRAPGYSASLLGDLHAPLSHGTITTPAGELTLAGQGLDLAGRLEFAVSATKDTAEPRMRLAFQQEPTTAAPMGAAQMPSLGLGAWAMPTAALIGLGFIGASAAAWRPMQQRLRARSPPAPPAAPEPVGSTATAEAAYRANPGDLQLAMQLALHYATEQRYDDAIPLLLMCLRQFPKSDVARYTTGIALLQVGRVDDALPHLEYSFRLNPLNVARFLKEGPAAVHGHQPGVEALLQRYARVFQESRARGYA